MIPHIIFYGGLDVELGKAAAEICVNMNKTMIKSLIKWNP